MCELSSGLEVMEAGFGSCEAACVSYSEFAGPPRVLNEAARRSCNTYCEHRKGPPISSSPLSLGLCVLQSLELDKYYGSYYRKR